MADSLKQKEKDDDPLLREKKLKQRLENMTLMAQRLDKQNRKLKDEELNLKIEFYSQDKDSDLLCKQLLYYKKQQ